MHKFINPYNFIPVNKEKTTNGFIGHESYKGLSGTITCSLLSKTRIFIPSTHEGDVDTDEMVQTNNGPQHHKKYLHFYYYKDDENKRPVIPGSSLRGVVRNVVEAATDSCFNKYDDLGNAAYEITDELLPPEISSNGCSPLDERLCITCQLFGCNGQAINQNGTSINNNYKSRVKFNDAIALSYEHGHQCTLNILDSPKPRHSSFYGKRGAIRGRKFYYHHRDYSEDLFSEICCRPNIPNDRFKHMATTITPLLSGSTFKFSVCFSNLSPEELGLLLWALELDDEPIDSVKCLCHKVGMGKPLGLGSVKIKVQELEFLNPIEKYGSIGRDGIELVSLENLTDYKNKYTSLSGNLDALKSILTFPKIGYIHYPDKRTWFDSYPGDTFPIEPSINAGELSNPMPEPEFYEELNEPISVTLQLFTVGQEFSGIVTELSIFTGKVHLENGDEQKFDKKYEQIVQKGDKAKFRIKKVNPDGISFELELLE